MRKQKSGIGSERPRREGCIWGAGRSAGRARSRSDRLGLGLVFCLALLVSRPGGLPCAPPACAAPLDAASSTLAHPDTARVRPEIHLAYVYEPGCVHCRRVEYVLKHLQRMHPQLVVSRYSVADPADAPVVEVLAQLYNLPSEQRLMAPAVFIGRHALVQEGIKEQVLRDLVRSYEVSGTEAQWVSRPVEGAAQSIVRRLESLGLLAVIAAGLLDGINPCAFTTLVFLISYLALAGRKGREIVLVGVSFTAAVFLTYLLIGLGALKFVQSLSFVPALSLFVYGLAACLAFVFAGLSFYDFLKFRSGRAGDAVLQLPGVLKQRIHKVIRTQVRSTSIILSTIVAGFLVSVFELACTGQVYLPTILFVTRTQGPGSRALLLLVLYNLMFVVPLVVVFLAVYGGASSQRIGDLARRHLGVVKLLTSALFLGLGTALLASLLF